MGKLSTVFNSNPVRLDRLNAAIYNDHDLAKETMLFSCDWRFANDNANPITKGILSAMDKHIPEESPDPDYPHLTIDTRVHMLMPNMYPGIPGWHCDFTPRNKKGQPKLKQASASQFNLAVFVSSWDDISRTEYLVKPNLFLWNWDKKAVWGSVDNYISGWENPPVMTALEGEIIKFSGQTLHRATPAK